MGDHGKRCMIVGVDDEQVRLMNESDYEQAIRRIGEAKHAEAAKYEQEFGVPCDWPLPKAGRSS
jgi:hypothetical protein